MKNLLNLLIVSILLGIFCAPSSVFGQEWHTTNQITVHWDAVTMLEGNIPFPEGDIIEYLVYLANAITDPGKTNPVEIGGTKDTSYVITVVNEGQYFVGLRTVRKILMGVDEENIIGRSIIGWTDDPAICLDENTFGIRYYLLPKFPINLSPSS